METGFHRRSGGFHRTIFAVMAALVAVAICVSRGHVQIALGDASTYSSALEHRCGLLMLACVAWALVEVMLYLSPLQTRKKI